MFATAVAMISLAMASFGNFDEFELGLEAPLLVDLFAWYIIGAYLGVLPSVA